MKNNVTFFNDGRIKEAEFNPGDWIYHEDTLCIITRVVVNPNVDYIFSYGIMHTTRGSDVPEDELVAYHEYEKEN